jgi:hypothetical protein
MKNATLDDADKIARQLNMNKQSVWEIIRGMRYESLSELALAVHKAIR